MYSENKVLPGSSDCWECYQPPIYYGICATILNTATSLELSPFTKWKSVQFLNILLSIILLFLYLKIMIQLKVSMEARLIVLSVLAFLPRDIFTSVMIGNDYLLTFFCVLAVLFFIRSYGNFRTRNSSNFRQDYFFLSLICLLSFFTKQHGLLMIVLPILLMLNCVIGKWNAKFSFVIILLTFTIISLNSYTAYAETGQLMVSNQHFFDYAINQQPGNISKVEFSTFRYFSLLQEPFISESTLQSLPTELFARTFFDYEWRFLSPNVEGSKFIGRIAYLWGMFWIILFAYWLFKYIKIRQAGFVIVALFVLASLFFLVPVIQTFRFPYFSSMKAMFVLPALIIMSICLSKFIPILRTNFIVAIVLGNIFIGSSLFGFIVYNFPLSLLDLHGPLWLYP